MKISIPYRIIITFIFLTGSLISCKKILEVSPADVVAQKNMYQNVSDADVAIMGVYGKFMNLAAPYVVLNELRADLMSVTANSDENLRQLEELPIRPLECFCGAARIAVARPEEITRIRVGQRPQLVANFVRDDDIHSYACLGAIEEDLVVAIFVRR